LSPESDWGGLHDDDANGIRRFLAAGCSSQRWGSALSANIVLASVMRFAPKWRVRLNELFAGVTWRMVAVAAVICLIDAIQDRVLSKNSSDDVTPLRGSRS
jgi:hypothetical protein